MLRATALATAVMVALPVAAHGFGQRYDLPLPLWLYLWATAAAIILSFVVAALFLRAPPRGDAYPRIDLLDSPFGRIASLWFARAIKLCSLALFVVAIAAGFFGNPNPYQNIAPTLVWVIGWVGIAYLSAFIGNLWLVLNPWRTVFNAAESCYRRFRPSRGLSIGLGYPRGLDVWPAFALLAAFSWLELVYPSPALPLHIAWFATAYSILTWIGMFAFGGETWLRNAELFTVVFGVFARFAPTEARLRDGVTDGLALRPYAAGLLDSRPTSISMTALVLLILATVLYDGVLGTPEWNDLELRIAALAPGFGDGASIAIRTLGLGAFWVLLAGAFLAVCTIMSAVASRRSAWELARSFAVTLVPIAIAYHLAHYLVYLLVQGQYVVPLLSDPFGYGWNLFGTAGHRVDIGIVDARFAWYTAVIAILAGHVVAVFLAHRRALQLFDARVSALRSQVPLTALMVGYTFLSLTILAEPITERRAPAPPGANIEGVSIPSDAVLPKAGSGRLLAVGAGKLAREKLNYRVLSSAFHDGSKLTAADLMYAYMFAYRWGVRNESEPSHYDAAVDSATAPLREQLAAVKIVGTDSVSKSFRVGDVNVVRELLIIDVYTKNVPEDPDQDAAIAPPWSTVPWHLLVLMEEAVSRGWAAFSQAEAARKGVEWLDLARSERINRQLASLVETFQRDGYRPESLQSLVSADDARKRWAALSVFYKMHGHFLVSNGPYVLKRWSDDSVDLDVFRDLSYPLGVGSYDAYAIPRRGFITAVDQDKDGLRLSAEIETIMKFQRSYEIQREDLQKVAPDVLKRSAPECRYTIVDGGGRVVLAGVVRPGTDASFRIDLFGKLAPGSYTVLAEIVVGYNAMNADIRRIPLVVAAAAS
jgi:hypothetical protein